MTQVERTIKFLNAQIKGTIWNKTEFEHMEYNFHRLCKSKGIKEDYNLTRWDTIIANPERFGVKRIEVYTTVPSFKYKALDVLDMIKQGQTIEEIEQKLYTQVKNILLEKL